MRKQDEKRIRNRTAEMRRLFGRIVSRLQIMRNDDNRQETKQLC